MKSHLTSGCDAKGDSPKGKQANQTKLGEF